MANNARSEQEKAELRRVTAAVLICLGIAAVIVLIVVAAVLDTEKKQAASSASTETTSAETETGESSGSLSDVVAGAVQQAEPELNTTEGTVCEEGDTVAIDYVGKKDGVAFDGGTGSYDLTLGSGQFIPGFEEGLVGHKVGETVDLNLTFPEQYHSEELAGAEVVFTVTINGVYK